MLNQPLAIGKKTFIEPNERVTIVGQTGSGKTYLAERLLKPIKRLIVFDVKGNMKERFNLEYDNSTPRELNQAWRALEENKPARVQIVQPIMSNDELAEYYDQTYFKRIFEIGNVVIYFDETYAIVQSANTIEPYLNAIFTQGREVKKIGVFASMQRPARIPVVFTSEAQHYFMFRLQKLADRKRMAETMGDEVLERIPDRYGFWYYNNDLEYPIYKSGI